MIIMIAGGVHDRVTGLKLRSQTHSILATVSEGKFGESRTDLSTLTCRNISRSPGSLRPE